MTRLIEEEEAFKVLSAYYKHSTPVQDSALHDALSRVPTAQPKRGKWIEKSTGGWRFYCCSECGYVEWDALTNYCPNCGARMVEE